MMPPTHQLTNSPTHQFTLSLSVRDYECDFQGIVNNAVYLNYLEHTRHEYAKAVGLNVVDLAKKGINIVVVRSEIDYKGSLRSGDAFVVGLNVRRLSRVRFVFEQEIYRLEENHGAREGYRLRDVPQASTESTERVKGRLVLQAKIIATAINEDGRPIIPPEVDVLF